ncbi:hypothetical protein BT69DRAFT_1317546 [Atractiella rhizophila]|nr:hypothetical protein BT69DRAFT_1317546 [Atractiella rhizophila]
MGIVEQTVGSIMIASWVNTALWALEIVLIYQYFATFGDRDYWLLRLAVVVMALSDTLCTVANQIGVYDYTITHWGEDQYLATQHWPIPTYLICTAVTSFIVQTYLTHRYWRLSRNNIIAVLLACLTLLGVGANISVAVAVVIYTSYEERSKIVKEVVIWFCAKAATDISIASALVFYLIQFRKRTVFEETRSHLVTMMLYAIETGAVTSAAALTAFALFVQNNNSNAATAFGQNLGRLYAVSMMFNLLFRKLMIRDNQPRGSEKTTPSSTAYPMRKKNLAGVLETDITNTGVIINHQSITHVDENRSRIITPSYASHNGAMVNLRGAHDMLEEDSVMGDKKKALDEIHVV